MNQDRKNTAIHQWKLSLFSVLVISAFQMMLSPNVMAQVKGQRGYREILVPTHKMLFTKQLPFKPLNEVLLDTVIYLDSVTTVQKNIIVGKEEIGIDIFFFLDDSAGLSDSLVSDRIIVEGVSYPLEKIMSKSIAPGWIGFPLFSLAIKEIYSLKYRLHEYTIISLYADKRSSNAGTIMFIVIVDQSAHHATNVFGFSTLDSEDSSGTIPTCINDFNLDGHLDFWEYYPWSADSPAPNIKPYTIAGDKVLPFKKQYIRTILGKDGSELIDLKRSNWFFKL